MRQQVIFKGVVTAKLTGVTICDQSYPAPLYFRFRFHIKSLAQNGPDKGAELVLCITERDDVDVRDYNQGEYDPISEQLGYNHPEVGQVYEFDLFNFSGDPWHNDSEPAIYNFKKAE